MYVVLHVTLFDYPSFQMKFAFLITISDPSAWNDRCDGLNIVDRRHGCDEPNSTLNSSYR